MKIAMANDHSAVEMKNEIKAYVESKGYEVIDFGTNSSESCDYPAYGEKVGRAVASGEAKYGIAICGTGIGISIATNKIKGVRCALCHNTTTARLTREHNDANVLALGGRIVGDVLALEMVDVFLDTKFEGGRHQTRINCIEED